MGTLTRGATVTALIVSIFTSQAGYSAGFQISETSVTGMGRAFAGSGISGDGPSDMFHNPAGLMLGQGRDMEVGLYVIDPNADYQDRGSTLGLLTPAGPLTIPNSGLESNGGETAFVPNFYYAADINEDIRYGLGISAPFGLTTEYSRNWIGRYQAIKSELITVEINPAVAFQVSDRVSIGGGVTLLKADAELSQAQFTGPTTPDALAKVDGDDTAVGFNFGFMAGDDKRRFGFGYRSSVDVEVDADLSINPLGVTAGAKAEVTLPATAYLSGFMSFNEKIDVLGSVRWTDWSEFDELRIDFDNGLPPAVTPENWDDSYTYSIGLNYRHNDQWTFRIGYALDETPLEDEFRTPRIPDTDRDWLTLGASYQASKKVRVDFSFAHLFTDDVPINESTNLISTMPGAATSNLNGEYTDTDANIFGLQVHIDLEN